MTPLSTLTHTHRQSKSLGYGLWNTNGRATQAQPCRMSARLHHRMSTLIIVMHDAIRIYPGRPSLDFALSFLSERLSETVQPQNNSTYNTTRNIVHVRSLSLDSRRPLSRSTAPASRGTRTRVRRRCTTSGVCSDRNRSVSQMGKMTNPPYMRATAGEAGALGRRARWGVLSMSAASSSAE